MYVSSNLLVAYTVVHIIVIKSDSNTSTIIPKYDNCGIFCVVLVRSSSKSECHLILVKTLICSRFIYYLNERIKNTLISTFLSYCGM